MPYIGRYTVLILSLNCLQIIILQQVERIGPQCQLKEKTCAAGRSKRWLHVLIKTLFLCNQWFHPGFNNVCLDVFGPPDVTQPIKSRLWAFTAGEWPSNYFICFSIHDMISLIIITSGLAYVYVWIILCMTIKMRTRTVCIRVLCISHVSNSIRNDIAKQINSKQNVLWLNCRQVILYFLAVLHVGHHQIWIYEVL